MKIGTSAQTIRHTNDFREDESHCKIPTHRVKMYGIFTIPKTNMDTQNDGLEKVTPLKHGNFWYLC